MFTRIAFRFALLVGLALVGWSAWTGNVALSQYIVLAVMGVLFLEDRFDWFDLSARLHVAFYFLAGAGIGICAYKGDVSLLIGILWLVIAYWIERQIRDEISDAFDVLSDL